MGVCAIYFIIASYNKIDVFMRSSRRGSCLLRKPARAQSLRNGVNSSLWCAGVAKRKLKILFDNLG